MQSNFAVLLVCCALGCARPESVLRGRVVDRLTGAPIAGAHVAASGGGFAITNADGRFEVVADGPASLELSAAGYLATRRPNVGDNVELSLFPERLTEAESDTLHAQLHRESPPREGDVRADFEEVDEGPVIVTAEQTWDPRFGQLRQGLQAPATIRVWRRRLDGSTTSCAGRVDVVPFEEYIKGVLPHEWIASWDKKSLRMGAVAIRSYAWSIVAAGGRYECADVDDTSNTQVYTDERLARTDAIVDETAGQVVMRNGRVVRAEYSAENGDPTAFGVADPHCAGKDISGHRRGTCQRGTQRWATIEGRDHAWMTAHYYPDAGLYIPNVTAHALGAVSGEAAELPPGQAEEWGADSGETIPHGEDDAGDETAGCNSAAGLSVAATLAAAMATTRRRRSGIRVADV